MALIGLYNTSNAYLICARLLLVTSINKKSSGWLSAAESSFPSLTDEAKDTLYIGLVFV